MKYIIYKQIIRKHKLNKETNLYELLEIPKYYIKRKGKYFGFSYDVGDWTSDLSGNRYCTLDKFDSIEQVNSYLHCWHIETYGDKEPIEINLDISVQENNK